MRQGLAYGLRREHRDLARAQPIRVHLACCVFGWFSVLFYCQPWQGAIPWWTRKGRRGRGYTLPAVVAAGDGRLKMRRTPGGRRGQPNGIAAPSVSFPQRNQESCISFQYDSSFLDTERVKAWRRRRIFLEEVIVDMPAPHRTSACVHRPVPSLSLVETLFLTGQMWFQTPLSNAELQRQSLTQSSCWSSPVAGLQFRPCEMICLLPKCCMQ
jgi:hypothetical protein